MPDKVDITKMTRAEAMERTDIRTLQLPPPPPPKISVKPYPGEPAQDSR